MIKAGLLTDKGLKEFRRQLFAIKEGEQETLDCESLLSSTYSTTFSPQFNLPDPPFSTMKELAESTLNSLPSGVNFEQLETNAGFWSFAAIVFIDSIVKNDGAGSYLYREPSRYLFEPERYTKFYRHLVYGPCRLHHYLGEASFSVLSGPSHTISDIYEQIASRQQIAMDRVFVETLNHVAFSVKKGRFKRGIGGRSRHSIRQLQSEFAQLALNYDVDVGDASKHLELLSDSFRAFAIHQ
jgi:hypothetical protein